MKSYKGYKEMTKCVLAARDEHLKKKRRRQAVIRRCVPAVSCFCLAAIIGLISRNNIAKPPEIVNIPQISEVVTATESETVFSRKNEMITTYYTSSESALTTSAAPSQQTASEATDTETEPTAVHSDTSAVHTAINGDPPETTEIITSHVTETASSQVTQQTTVVDGDISAGTGNQKYLHWDEMTINQQYFMAEFRDTMISYSTSEKEVSDGDVGEFIGEAYMSGYDWYDQIYYHCDAKAYKIKGDDNGETIAVKFTEDEKYYLYTLNPVNNKDQLSG